MNRPTIDSIPGSSAGRPDTVAPNTTSSRPVTRPSSTPQAAWISGLVLAGHNQVTISEPPAMGADRVDPIVH